MKTGFWHCFLISLGILAFSRDGKAQSPGGVSSNLKIWVKGDVGVTGTTNVSSWADQSGLANNFTQGTAANQPALVTNDVNAHATINFSGNTTIMSPVAAPANLNSTIFTVAVPTINTNWRTMFRGSVNDHPLIVQTGGTTLGYYDGDNGGFKSGGFTWLQNEAAVVGLEMRAGDVNFRKNGTQGASIATINLAGLNLNYFGNYQGSGQPFGRIAETIIYNSASALNTTEKEKIESYLAVKYGITLSHNYLASDGSVIWDVVANAGYSNNISGIGRDDLSALDQQSSASVNAAGAVRMDEGAAFASDLNFILWGDNNVNGTNANVAAPYFFRSARVWRAAVKGTPANVTFSVDLQTIGFPVSSSATDYVLLKDTDTDFSAGATVHSAGVTLVGNTLSFTGVNFSDGDYFAIAETNLGLPGGVAGTIFWVKGDVGVTGTTNVSSWADQSGASANATQAAPANQPALQTADINTHSTISFSTNAVLSLSNAPANLNSTIFTVAVPAVNTNWRTMFRGTVSDHPIIVQTGGTTLGYYDGDNGGFKSGGFTWLQNEAAVVGLEMRTGDVNFRKNGTQGASIATINLAGLNLNYFGNYQGTGQPFGRIAETLIYNTAAPLSATEKEKIESYLAVKYGITLTHNYLASDGATVWDLTANAGYNNNITGIGRDDQSSLDQQKSESLNANATVTLDKGSSFATDKSFILIGDDVATGTSSNISAAYTARTSRVWRSRISGVPGAINLSIDLQTVGFPNTGSATDYVLLTDTDTDFSAGATPHTSGASLAGDLLSFTGITLNDGEYFTLAAANVVLPAGIVGNLTVWLKADQGPEKTGNIPAGNGDALSRWVDQSGNGRNYTAVAGPTLQNNTLNFNPSVEILAGGLDAPAGTELSNDWTVFFVSQKLASDNNGRLFDGHTGNFLWAHWSNYTNSIYLNAVPANHNVGIATAVGIENLHLHTYKRESTGGTLEARADGTSLTTFGTSNSANGTRIDIDAGANATESSDARVGEMILYNSVLTPAEVNKIESYLGIKYGLTLSHNYSATNGTVLWDIAANTGYNNNISGIGREDASGLSQQKSLSTNATGSVTLDKGGAFANDRDFILWGDNMFTGTSSNVSAPYAARANRIWKTVVTGTPGAVNFSVNLSVIGLPNTANAADYVLLTDTDIDFSAGATAHIAGVSLVGNTLSFTGVTFNSNEYFTIAATNLILPGGIAGSVFWVKGDAGVTGTTDVSNWADQSGTGNDATQNTVAFQPSLVTDAVNFNPVIDFSGNTDVMSPLVAPANLNSTIFTVGVPMVNSNWRTLFRGSVNDHPIIVQNGATTLGYYDNDNVGLKSSGFTWAQDEVALVGLEMRAGDVNFRKNGTQGASIATINLNGLNLNYFGNYLTGGQPFGKVAETIIFNTPSPLTATEKEKIESYLAVKYGLTLSHNYLAGDGSVFWDITVNAGYNNSITAVGREDASSLDQRKSKSSNTGSVLTLEKTTSFSANKDFWMAGDDGGSLGATIVNAHPAYPMRVERVWRANLNGAPGTVNISFDLGTGIYNSGIATDYALLYKTGDTDFSTGATAYTTGASIVANVLTFTNVPLASADYFTLALPRVPAPGGVITGLKVWLRADAGVYADAGITPASDGGVVQRWADQTTLQNHATQTGSPVWNSTNNLINFNPTVYYNGVSGHNLPYSGSNQYSVITMGRMEGPQNRRMFASLTGNVLLGTWNGLEDVLYLDTNPSQLVGPVASTNPKLYSTVRATSGSYQFQRNGFNLYSGAASSNSVIRLGIGNGGVLGESSKAFVSEVIQYDRNLSAAELSKVNSYMAVKYGISIDQTVATNYVTANGTVIWDATVNAGYKFNITGIGRDDASLLDQRKSRSSNTGVPVIIDKGAAFGTDLDFLVWGSDNAFLGPTTTNAHPSYPFRVGKTWRADVSGTPGAVSVSFDLSVGIYNSNNAADYALLIKNSDANFSLGATAYTTGASFSGSVLTFTGVNFADGDYFTLALPAQPSPGGVFSNLHYWLKADAGVTGVATVSGWTDQSGNGYTVSQPVAASQPAYISNRTNFNPAVKFDGSNDQLLLTGGIMGTSTYTDINAIVVSRVNAVSASSVFWETQASGGRINAHMPWSDNALYWDAGSSGASQRLSIAWGGAVATNYLWSLTASTTATPSGARQDIYRNGRRIANDNTMASFTGNNSTFSLASTIGANYFNGDIDEIVLYRGALTLAQLQRIQSYLAIKYGITLDQTAAQNYYASDWNGLTGTTVWDALTSGSYKNDIAIIGRDDLSALSQKQSASVNAGNILAVGNSTIAVDNISNGNSFAADKSFFAWGHNNLALNGEGVSDFGLTVNAETIQARMARAWLARETGTVGTLRLRFDLSSVPGVGAVAGANELADVRLLVDGDGLFLAGATSVAPTAYDNVTNIVEFDYDFNVLTGFYFSIGSVNAATAPLPVELLGLEATPEAEGITVRWATASEINNHYFEVQASPDGENWTTVAQVDGQGTKHDRTDYKILDESPFVGTSYYRLRQVDFDGTTIYSNIVHVNYYPVDSFKLFPNPSDGKQVNVKLSLSEWEAPLVIKITNLQGMEMRHFVVENTVKGNVNWAIDLDDLDNGVYLVMAQVGTNTFQTKLIVSQGGK